MRWKESGKGTFLYSFYLFDNWSKINPINIGPTTAVRLLFAGFDSSEISAANIVSYQIRAGDSTGGNVYSAFPLQLPEFNLRQTIKLPPLDIFVSSNKYQRQISLSSSLNLKFYLYITPFGSFWQIWNMRRLLTTAAIYLTGVNVVEISTRAGDRNSLLDLRVCVFADIQHRIIERFFPPWPCFYSMTWNALFSTYRPRRHKIPLKPALICVLKNRCLVELDVW